MVGGGGGVGTRKGTDKSMRARNCQNCRQWQPHPFISEKNQRATTKRAKSSRRFFTLFGTFPHFITLFRVFLQDLFLELRGFTTVLVQRDVKRIKDDKKENAKPFCTLVVTRLSSSNYFLPDSPFLAKVLDLDGCFIMELRGFHPNLPNGTRLTHICPA